MPRENNATRKRKNMEEGAEDHRIGFPREGTAKSFCVRNFNADTEGGPDANARHRATGGNLQVESGNYQQSDGRCNNISQSNPRVSKRAKHNDSDDDFKADYAIRPKNNETNILCFFLPKESIRHDGSETDFGNFKSVRGWPDHSWNNWKNMGKRHGGTEARKVVR